MFRLAARHLRRRTCVHGRRDVSARQLRSVVLAVVLVSAVAGACRIHPGANHLLLVTESTSGFNVDTVPAVIELSLFGRFDGVHGPSFEDAQTPPVITSFKRQKGFWAPTGAAFASGPAARAIASYAAETGGRPEGDAVRLFEARCNELSEIELSRPPHFDNPSKELFAAGEAPPMWFATTETLGLQIEFFGPSFPPFVQSVHVGYRRKEFLATPLAISEEPTRARPFVVRTPSVLALVNVLDAAGRSLQAGDAKTEGANHPKTRNPSRTRRRVPRRVQLFATGRAATRLAADPRVRKLFLNPLVGEHGDTYCRCTEDGVQRNDDE